MEAKWVKDLAARDRVGGYKVDVRRDEQIGRVSSEWFSRPPDERYLPLSGPLRRRARDRTQPDPDAIPVFGRTILRVAACQSISWIDLNL